MIGFSRTTFEINKKIIYLHENIFMQDCGCNKIKYFDVEVGKAYTTGDNHFYYVREEADILHVLLNGAQGSLINNISKVPQMGKTLSEVSYSVFLSRLADAQSLLMTRFETLVYKN